jgi:hypothetical protein
MSGNLVFAVICVGAAIVVFVPAYLLDRRRKRKAAEESAGQPSSGLRAGDTARLMRGAALPPEAVVENYANLPDAIRVWGAATLILGTIGTAFPLWSMLMSGDVPLGLPISLVSILVGSLAILCPEPVMCGVLIFTYIFQTIPSLAPGDQSLCSAGNLISLGITLFELFLLRVMLEINRQYEALPADLQVVEATNHAEGIFPALGALLGGAAVLTRIFLWLMMTIVSVSAQAAPFVASLSVIFGIPGFAISLSSLIMGFKRGGLSFIGVFSSGALLLFWLMLVFGIIL